MKYLFIAGPMNGELLHDLEGDKITVPTPGEYGFGEYAYKRSSLTFDECGLFIPQDWSEDKAMSFLIEMYSNYSGLLDNYINV